MPAPGPGRWASLLADDAIAVAVSHVGIGWMTTPHRGNAVPTRLRARDATVAIVSVLLQRSRADGSWGLTCRSPSTPSWNQIMALLREMAELRESGVVAA